MTGTAIAGRPRNPLRVGEFASEIEPAAKSEYVGQPGVSNLRLTRQLKGCLRTSQKLSSASAGPSRREHKYAFHVTKLPHRRKGFLLIYSGYLAASQIFPRAQENLCPTSI
jgi:hypothetical protein